MKMKVSLCVLVASVIVVSIFYLKSLVPPETPAIDNPSVASVARVGDPPAPPKTTATLAFVPLPIPLVAVDTNVNTEEPASVVQAEVDKLNALQANDDPDSLRAILADLASLDREIRAAAVESAIQFGSRDAIPALKDQAIRTLDPEEKKNLLDAVDFLALPKLSEVLIQPPAPSPPSGPP